MPKIKADPEVSVMLTNPFERVIGSHTTLELPIKPKTEGESDLAADTFFSLFQEQPSVRAEVSPERAVNHTLMKWAMEAPTFEETHAATRGNIVSSSLASGLLWLGLTRDESIQEALKEQEEAKEKQKQAEEEMQKAAEQLQKAQDAEDEDEQAEAEAQAMEHEKNAQDLMSQAQEIAQDAAQKVEQLSQNALAGGMMSAALSDAQDKAQEANAIMAGWGIDPGTVGSQDVDTITQLATSHDAEFMRRLADMIGRAEDIAKQAIASTRAGKFGTVTEAALTKDITKVFPGERIMLSPGAPPIIRLRKLHRLFTSGLPGYRPVEDAERKGAFHCEMDASGSMSGDSIVVAKSIALGIGYALLNDKSIVERRYSISQFATRSDPEFEVTSDDDWRAHIDWARKFINGGGTDFDFAIQRAIAKLKAMHGEGIEGADCLFITDGWARVSQKTMSDWRDLAAETGAKMIVVAVGGYGNDELQQLSSAYIQITSYDDLKRNADDIIRQITTNIIENEDQEGGD